jgi:predicted DNA binding CopG/RHH family protein
MAKGRSTTPITVRLPDNLLATFKAKAAKKSILYTVFIRQLIQKELGLPQK